MAIVTSQKIAVYYERYKTIDVTFSKEIIQVSGLTTNQVFLKCVGDLWPCVIFSSSFQGAKVIVSIKSGILQKLERANNMLGLRFCFKIPDKANPVAFFINTKSVGYTPYGGSNDVALFTLQFTQRPPDDLIEIMGRILDANVASTKRTEERILIANDTARKLNLASKESAIFMQGVPRNCILRDLSFSGAKIIMMGVAKFLVNKEAALRVDFEDPRESFLIKGKFLRAEAVEGRKELVALVILFDTGTVPMGYKIRINDYLSVTRADERGSESTSVEKISEAGSPGAKSSDLKPPDGIGADKKPNPEKAGPAASPAAQLPPAASSPAKQKSDAAPAPTGKPSEADGTGSGDFTLDLPAK